MEEIKKFNDGYCLLHLLLSYSTAQLGQDFVTTQPKAMTQQNSEASNWL